MKLVGSANKGCNVFGRELNPQASKFYTETIFNNLTSSKNFIDSLMTTDSLGRMDFLAHKISEEIKVNIQNLLRYTKYQIVFVLFPAKTRFTFAKTLMLYFRMRTTDKGSPKDSQLIYFH